MNPKDKKHYEEIKKLIKLLPKGEIFSEQYIENFCNTNGMRVYNMSSVLQSITNKTNLLERLENGQYRRTER